MPNCNCTDDTVCYDCVKATARAILTANKIFLKLAQEVPDEEGGDLDAQT